MQPADSEEQATAGLGFAHQPRAATSQGRILFPSARDEAADVYVSEYRDPSIPASSIKFPPVPILPRFHTSVFVSPSLCRSLLFPPLHCYRARLGGGTGPTQSPRSVCAPMTLGMREEHQHHLEQPAPAHPRTTTDRQYIRKAAMDTTDQFQSTARTPNAPASTLSDTSQDKLSSRVAPSPYRMQCRLQERATHVLIKNKPTSKRRPVRETPRPRPIMRQSGSPPHPPCPWCPCWRTCSL